jgi:pimeloyl-ACP methyl ester carboxylesterase
MAKSCSRSAHLAWFAARPGAPARAMRSGGSVVLRWSPAREQEGAAVPAETTTGYAPVNGLHMYWESRGEDGVPLIVTHGGYGLTSMFGELLDQLAGDRRVIAIELQGHGHTADINREFRYEHFGDDIAALIEHLGLGRADLLGYSLGGNSSLRCAIQHPDLVRKLALVSIPYRRADWYPEVLAGMDEMSSAGFEQLRHAPMYPAYRAVAPDPEAFPALMDKTGELLRRDYDWSKEISQLPMPVLLVCGDSDSISPVHAAGFYSLLGGGQRDSGWDGTLPTQSRLAILPGRTHYDIFAAPELGAIVTGFLA